MRNTLALLCALLSLSGCSHQPAAYNPDTVDSQALKAIDQHSYHTNISKLASDEFQGRKPFTKGDTLAVNYIQEQFKSLGLLPGNNGSYFQQVPMVEVSSQASSPSLSFKGKNGTATFKNLEDYLLVSRKQQEHISVKNTELIFAGFGIVAPEYNWNDYEGLDVKGKTVVLLVSDPGQYDKNLFKADTMTYYGRWTYKYEEAARQGATGVILIHETKAASYGWDVVRSGWSAPQLVLNTPNTEPVTDFEGWISLSTAKSLFQLAGLKESLLEEAKKPGFKAIPMGISTDVEIQNSFKRSSSSNVIAKIQGTKRPEETIIYSAHWDHLGIGEPVQGDSIYNGAIDNAAGVAALFEIAKAFKNAQTPPERTIAFIALTAEEQGLLGSQFYAENPIFPLNKTVANLNMDAFSPLGETKDVSIVGIGQTEIEDYVLKAAKKFGRTVKAETNPSSGGFYRSDHFNFVKKGVPGLFMGAGSELLSPDTAAIQKRKAALQGRYHSPQDQIDENWDLKGIIADMYLFFDVGNMLSHEKTFPQFKAKSEFRILGEKRLSK